MRRPITVKQLGNYIRAITLEDVFLKDIYITGEVTNLSKRKYTYFSLKEDDEMISCIIFDDIYNFSEGDKVNVKGSINVYLRDGKYQIRVTNLEKTGMGDNLEKINKLKEKLSKKGYFDINNKKKIPAMPLRIGLITGKESAAYYDFLKVLNDNKYNCELYLFNSLVQGIYAKEEILEALDFLDSIDLDLIVITRGGGSKTDLDTFNEELIADKVFNTKTPILSAVGHEIDLSIVDLTSDLYLSTPTKSAEFIVSNYNIRTNLMSKVENNIKRNIINLIQRKEEKLKYNNLLIKSNNPINKIEKLDKNINDIKDKIIKSINKNLDSLSFNIIKNKDNIYNSFNNIMNMNQLYIKDLDNNLMDINKLDINSSYILFNDNISYKIKVEDKINE